MISEIVISCSEEDTRVELEKAEVSAGAGRTCAHTQMRLARRVVAMATRQVRRGCGN